MIAAPRHLISDIDPVSAYDAISADFAQLTAARRPWLDAIDATVLRLIRPGARSLLDVGAGDARRARCIATAAGIEQTVLVEPSVGMRRTSSSQTGYVDLRAEQLSSLPGEFDVILCLWNVLGHIFPGEARLHVLRQFNRLLTARGRLFIDVNHRYNAARYGALRTAGRYLYDCLRPSANNGDVVVTWHVGNHEARVRGHVFTDSEFRGLARQAGLVIEQRFVLDYDTGQPRSLATQGNLLYVVSGRASRQLS